DETHYLSPIQDSTSSYIYLDDGHYSILFLTLETADHGEMFHMGVASAQKTIVCSGFFGELEHLG
ncbi:hypothetical protein HN51_062271, partial [Arachis hypogaea]